MNSSQHKELWDTRLVPANDRGRGQVGAWHPVHSHRLQILFHPLFSSCIILFWSCLINLQACEIFLFNFGTQISIITPFLSFSLPPNFLKEEFSPAELTPSTSTHSSYHFSQNSIPIDPLEPLSGVTRVFRVTKPADLFLVLILSDHFNNIWEY